MSQQQVRLSSNEEEEEDGTEHIVRHYFCHSCVRVVDVDSEYKCTECHRGFVELLGLSDHEDEIYNDDGFDAEELESNFFERSRPISSLLDRRHIGPLSAIHTTTANSNINSLSETQRNVSEVTFDLDGGNSLNEFLQGFPEVFNDAYDISVIMLRILQQGNFGIEPGTIPPADVDSIKNLSEKEITPDVPMEDRECVICKEALPMSEKATLLPCGHFFHRPCVEYWLKMHNSCPVCRSSI